MDVAILRPEFSTFTKRSRNRSLQPRQDQFLPWNTNRNSEDIREYNNMNSYIEVKLYLRTNRDPDQLPIVPAGNVRLEDCLPLSNPKLSLQLFCPKL